MPRKYTKGKIHEGRISWRLGGSIAIPNAALTPMKSMIHPTSCLCAPVIIMIHQIAFYITLNSCLLFVFESHACKSEPMGSFISTCTVN